MRITGSDTYGKNKLDYFISVSSPYPVIATTSKLLTTGADCKMTKLIVLDQMIGSMTEFKQIIGRGTRLREKEGKTHFEDANQYMKDGVLLRQIINIIDELDLSDYEEVHAFGEIYETILKELQSAGSSGEFYTPRAVTDFMAKMIQPQIGEKMADFACGTGGFITSWLKELSPKIQDTEDQEAYDNSIYGIEKKPFPYILCVTNMLLHGLDVPRVYHDNSLLRDVLDYSEDDQLR